MEKIRLILKVKIKILFTIQLVVFNIFMCCSQSNGDYRSIASGNWNDSTIWQVFNTTWGTPSIPPTSANGVITIQATHTVTIPSIPILIMDQVVVNAGGILSWTGGSLIIANGSGIDLSVDGEFRDYITTSNNINFSTGATWSLNTSGTFVKNNSNATVAYRDKYAGGLVSIASTTNWILRKTGTDYPVIFTTGAYFGNLIIESNLGFWDATAPSSTFQGSGAPTIRGNLDIGGTGSGTVKFYDNRSTVSLQILKDLITRTGSTFQTTPGFLLSGSLSVSGILNYTDSPTFSFIGSNPQTISGGGTLNIYKLTINKPSNNVTLARPITVDNLTTLSKGIVFSDATNLFTMAAGASSTATNNNSFVAGPIKKIGNTSITFPTGDNGRYQPIEISTPSLATDEFTAQYFDTGALSTYTGSCTSPLDHVTACDYWILNRTSGSSNVIVKLSWDSLNNSSICNINDFATLVVGRYNGTNWVSEGNSGTTGNFANGTVTSNTVTSFSPFAIGSLGTLNPLPVELLYFEALKKEENQVAINWATATEINNDYFLLERATNDLIFEPIEIFDGAGNSSQTISYSAVDKNPTEGMNYYRLKQIDKDGGFTYSEIKSVNCLGNKNIFNAEMFGSQIIISLVENQRGKFEVIDVTGKILISEFIEPASEYYFQLQTKGLYFARFTNNNESETIKLVYQ